MCTKVRNGHISKFGGGSMTSTKKDGTKSRKETV